MTPLSKAITQLNVSESPKGSDNVKYNTWYYGKVVEGFYPWCAVFVYWCYCKANCKSFVQGVENHAYCQSYIEWAKVNGRWKTKPKKGYLALFQWEGHKDRDADHIGFVEKVNSDGTITTIEGNHDGEVARVVRKCDKTVLGYIAANGNTEPTQTSDKKSVNQVAVEVIDGLWGNGEERKEKLTTAGYSYKKVQTRVNEILYGK